MADEQTIATPVAETVLEHVENQSIQQANTTALEKTDPIEAGIQQPVKMEGVADKTEKVYGEKTDPAAPVAAPIQQIAPLSANGEQTSARSAPQTDAPVNVQEPTPVANDINPSADEASPSVTTGVDTSIEQAQPESQPKVAFEDMPPLEQANNLLQQIPGRFRLY